MYITAAPVGAVPKYLNPAETKFISNFFLDYLMTDLRKNEMLQVLIQENWELVESDGIALQFGYVEKVGEADLNALPFSKKQTALEKLCDMGWINQGNEWINPSSLNQSGNHFKIARSTLESIPSHSLTQQIVLQLTIYGWQLDDEGNLVWPDKSVHSYIPPKIVAQLRSLAPATLELFLNTGWSVRSTGYWQPGKARSPYLPLSPEKIIEEAHLSFQEGASIVHIHTRDSSDECSHYIPGLGALISSNSQTNHIETDHYDQIIPALLRQDPSGILNISTSVRGDKIASDNPLRRAHLKPYGVRKTIPDIASFSPGPVLFQKGGGYDNPEQFIEEQLSCFKTYGILPEIEVFNHTILENTLTTYKEALLHLENPLLFMLVACVDQHHHDIDTNTLTDNSLIPTPIREQICQLIHCNNVTSLELAIQLAVEYLSPIVLLIRQHFPGAKISMLLPGPLQPILIDVAITLQLDGIRIGLEDGLNIYDEHAPGGVRRALGTYEQVRAVRTTLEQRGISVTTAEQFRDVLGIAREDIKLFRQVAALLKPYSTHVDNPSTLPNAQTVLTLLEPIARNYHKREEAFVLEIASYLEKETQDAYALAPYILERAKEHGLYIRLFIEEKDRYADQKHLTFTDVYTPQALNFVRELLHERSLSTALIDTAIAQYSDSSQTTTSPEASYLIRPEQFKSPGLRFLEYVTDISCQYNSSRTDVFNLEIRQAPDYSTTMAVLFHAIRELNLVLHKKSTADEKKDGIVWYTHSVDGHTARGENRIISATELAQTITNTDWIVLPSTPTTNYPLGFKLSTGLTGTFYNFITQILNERQSAPQQKVQTEFKLLGLTHSGLDENNEPIIEASMLYNRFTLNTNHLADFSNYSSRLIYERLLLPRMLQNTQQLSYTERGQIVRDNEGFPIYPSGERAARITEDTIEQLPLLKLLAHSSGIATAQQLDNLLRQDAVKLGFSLQEQHALFNKMLIISFASASDAHLHHLGSNIIDVTAFNDVRSLGGTTTGDCIFKPGPLKKYMEKTLENTRLNPSTTKYDYAHALPIFSKGELGKTLVRLQNVFLLDDPVRLHDGHSIRRYLGLCPAWLKQWFAIIYDSPLSTTSNEIIAALQKSYEDNCR